jgi:hypothetical protein
MNTTHSGKGPGDERKKHAAGHPGSEVPKRPADSTAGGDARNDTGEDNQRQKGERPAQDYVRR